jgi:hypothetical protein
MDKHGSHFHSVRHGDQWLLRHEARRLIVLVPRIVTMCDSLSVRVLQDWRGDGRCGEVMKVLDQLHPVSPPHREGVDDIR